MTIEKSEILAAISAVHVTEYPLGTVLADNVLNGIAEALLPLITASYRAGAEGWQPIDTAPKDMTEVIGMEESGDVHITWYFAPSSRTQGWLRKGGYWWKPTHWMPRPPLPLKEEG